MTRLYAGTDPGMSGAIAFLDEDGELLYWRDMPVRRDVSKNTVDITSLSQDKVFHSFLEGKDIQLAIERVNPMPAGGTANGKPAQGIASTGAFMRAAGKIEGFWEAKGLLPALVMPSVWKRHFGLLKTNKRASVELAKQIWPEHEKIFLISKDGRAEAALIARYLWETNQC